MVEHLLSCATLLSVGLMSEKEYNDILDILFIEMPEDDLLLDLEFVSSDMYKTISAIQLYCEDHYIDYTIYGRFLIEELRKAYSRYSTDIEGFAAKVYELWKVIPSTIQLVEPFYTMCYADDPLNWGDVEQTKKLYEKMFRFYDET